MASLRQVISCSFLSIFLPFVTASVEAQARKTSPPAPAHTHPDRTLPLVFERNEGQLPEGVGFLGRTQHYSVAVGSKDLTFLMPGPKKTSSVVLSFNDSAAAAPVGLTTAAFLTNYYVGTDASKFHTGIKNYSRIGLSHVYPGVDAQFYATGETIEHDFLVAPNADASLISMQISGAEKASINAKGEVLIPAQAGELRLKKPVAYQLDPQGKHIEVPAAFVLASAKGDSRELHFQLGDYDHTRELVIDPEIVYATYFSGTDGSTAGAVASDATGNVYLVGSTTSLATTFGTSHVRNYGNNGTPSTIAFVARFLATDTGTNVSWLTVIGSQTPSPSAATSVAMQQGSSPADVFFAGTTSATDFPTTGGSFQSNVPAASVQRGFVGSLKTADGTRDGVTFIDSDPTNQVATTAVNAIAADSNGNVLVAGTAVGNALPLTNDQIVVDPAAMGTTNLKGFVLRLDPTLVTEQFGTYLMGAGLFDTAITSVTANSTDPASQLIYVGGYTKGVFPYAGVYNTNNMFTHNAADNSGYDSFAAQITPATLPQPNAAPYNPATLGYSAWFSGSGNDQINGIALNSTSQLYLFGQTSSTDLTTTATYTNGDVTTPTGGTPGTPVSATLPSTASTPLSGFVAQLNQGGIPVVVTYLGGTNTDLVQAGAVDSTGRVYAAGTSTSSKQMSYPTASQLSAGQDTTVSNVQHGFVAQLSSGLDTVSYIANIGGATGPDSAAGVSLDSTGKAYVAANIAKSSLAYTNITAYQFLPNTASASTNTSAYVAEIENSATSSNLTLTATASGHGSPDPIGYVATSPDTPTYTWTLNSTPTTPGSPATAPVDLLVEIPANQYLNYTTIQLLDVTSNASVPSAVCTIVPTPPSTTTVGASCRIPGYTPGTNDTLNIVLGTTLLSQPPDSTISLTASVYGPGPNDYVKTSEISNVQMPTQLSVTTAAVPGTLPYIFTTNSGAAAPNTLVSYSFTVSNAAGAGPANNTVFTLTPPTGPTAFVPQTITPSATGGAALATSAPACTIAAFTTTGCTLSIPAGGSYTLTLAGTYPDAALNGPNGATGTATGTFTASATDFKSNDSKPLAPTTALQRGVHLKVTGSLNAPPTGQTNFNLGDTLTYTVNVLNSGPSASSGADTLTFNFTLPPTFTGFTAPAGLTCNNASPNVCTFAAIASGATAGPFVFTGTYPDNAANAAIGSPATPTLQASFSTTAALVYDYESGTPGSDYNAPTVAATIQRTANLAISASTLTVPTAPACAGGGTACLFILNSADTSDRVPYTFTVSNSGPNVATNAVVTIPLPSAPQNPAGTPHPLTVVQSAPPAVTAPGFGTGVTCTFSTSPNQIVCNTGNLAVGPNVLSLTGYLTADVNTVPANSIFTTAPSPGSVTATATAVGGSATGSALPAIQIDRVSHLVTTKVVSFPGLGSTPTGSINLDENSSSTTAGKNDTLSVTVSVGNMALNTAPNVVLTDTLPPYFRLIQAPAAAANCTVGGVALTTTSYVPGANPVTFTCNLGNLAPGAATRSNGGTAATVGAGAVAFMYAGKFLDNATNADITGGPTLASKVKSLTVSLGSASAVASFTFDPYTPSDATSTVPSVTVIRAAHLVTLKTVAPTGTSPSSPVNLDENKPSLAAGIDDTVTATISVGNTPLNNAIGVVLTDTLPPYFRVTQFSASASACTVGGVVLATNYATGANPTTLTCTLGTLAPGTSSPSVGATAATVGTPSYILTYSGKFLDNGVNADITGATFAAKQKSLSVSVASSNSVTPYAVDPLTSSDATSATSSLAVQRLVHFILRKSRNTTVAAVPSSFNDTTDQNLDEKTTATRFGVNDEIEYDIALANAGRNNSLGVQFTDTLPAYFTVVSAYAVSGSSLTPDIGANSVPANQLTSGSVTCFQGTSSTGTPLVLPFANGGSPMQITCTYGTPAAPLSLAAGGKLDTATAIQFIYQGKYQDNAPNVDNIPAGASTFTVTSNAGDASGSDMLGVDSGPLADGRSLALATYGIQRAAHLQISSGPRQVLTNDQPLTPDPTGGSAPYIGAAEPSTVAGANPVFNCYRNKVYIQNSGPNIARQPQLAVIMAKGLTLTSIVSGMTTAIPGADPVLTGSCLYNQTIASNTLVSPAALVPTTQMANGTLVVDVDGYFGLTALTGVNSLTFPSTTNLAAITYTTLTDPGIKDSQNKTFTATPGPALTVVNTPVGSNFTVFPVAQGGSTTTNGTQPVRLAFTSVAVPGITSQAITPDGPALPTGPSPDPRDNKKIIQLYRSGAGSVNYYKIGTNAIPATGTNPTGVCINNPKAATLTDTFAKPERVLLWTLLNAPNGTSFNPVPNVTAPYTGDITTSLTPSNAASGAYLEAGAANFPYTSLSNIPPVQSQPAMVCGNLNGFASTTAPVTLAALEPVNFAPYLTANTQSVAPPPSKGVSATALYFPTAHDYNDNDPCYVNSTTNRGVCDDNLVLTTWVFGGEALIPAQPHIVGLTPATTAAFTGISYNVSSGAALFDLIADQLASLNYALKPCDIGFSPAGATYSPITVNGVLAPCPVAASSLTGTPPQGTVYGSAQLEELISTGSNGGISSGLIVLPPAATATLSSSIPASSAAMASATITAGQTVGFQWILSAIAPSTTPGTYTLLCYPVNSTDFTTPPSMTLPTDPRCTTVPTYTPATATSDPAIYVSTSGTLARNDVPANGPSWKTLGGGIVVALLIPFMIVRRRYPRQFGLLTLLLLLTGAIGLSGCGTGGTVASSTLVTPAGTYYFRVSATPGSGTPAGTLYSTAFSVKVVAGN